METTVKVLNNLEEIVENFNPFATVFTVERVKIKDSSIHEFYLSYMYIGIYI